MDRDSIFLLPEDAPGTFAKDESLPPLPLPGLKDTLDRYYESLRPFGTPEELKHSKELITKFLATDGPKLQTLLEKRAKETKNWIEKWWEDYAYLMIRTPLTPTCLMATTVPGEAFNIIETPQNFLKTAAQILRFSTECWSLIHNERVKPTTNPSGTVTFSSATYMRLYNTSRIPGKEIDEIKSYFTRKSQGRKPPSHYVIIGRGRFFVLDALRPDGNIKTLQEFYRELQMINSALLEKTPQASVAFLTQDERTNWAENRQHLLELAPENAETLRIIESAIYTYAIDDREPGNHSETAQMAVSGGEAIWADKSASVIIHRNGMMGFLGEHSCYDGSMSALMNFYIMLSIVELPGVDWDAAVSHIDPPREIRFVLDDKLRQEIRRMEGVFEKSKSSVAVVVHTYQKFGKDYMKNTKIHPDSFVQAAIQLTYHRLHGKIACCYETATMREYYHGRTETVRSCDMKMVEMCRGWSDPSATHQRKWELFKAAADSQMNLMNLARQGKGVDRHLMALYCTAVENGFEIPEIFTADPLSARSGGGGNFTLSTSTLGYTINMGLVAPMITDGYGCFYSMLRDAIWCMVTTYKESNVTCGGKFASTFDDVMDEISLAYQHSTGSKL